MPNNPIQTYLLMLLLPFCANLYAGPYNITINVNGEEYYSDQNGFSEKAAAPKPEKTTVSRSHRKSVSKRKKDYENLVAEAAKKHQVDPKLVHAVIQAESSYNPTAVSSAGAVGLMQLMPGTARRFGVNDRRDAYQNIDGGTRYLKHLIKLFDSNLNLAVAAYNAGENAVIRNNNSIPPYTETRNYVKEVLSLQDYLKHGSSGSMFDSPQNKNNNEGWGNSGYTIEINYP